MVVNGTVAQAVGASMFLVTVKLTDPDAKSVMVATPNVTMTVGANSYKVQEMNPTVVPGVYVASLQTALKVGAAKDAAVSFGL